jgi:hypothetical protein
VEVGEGALDGRAHAAETRAVLGHPATMSASPTFVGLATVLIVVVAAIVYRIRTAMGPADGAAHGWRIVQGSVSVDLTS